MNQTEEGWLVPSQSMGERTYKVDPQQQTCTCPDHAENGHKCKHIFAVEFTMKREIFMDGTITETKTITFTEEKRFTRDWPAYNAAQSTEKKRLQVLLADLCRNLPERDCAHKRGPKPHLVKDSIFSMVLKI